MKHLDKFMVFAAVAVTFFLAFDSAGFNPRHYGEQSSLARDMRQATPQLVLGYVVLVGVYGLRQLALFFRGEKVRIEAERKDDAMREVSTVMTEDLLRRDGLQSPAERASMKESLAREAVGILLDERQPSLKKRMALDTLEVLMNDGQAPDGKR